MSLSTSLNTAKTSLFVSGEQTSLVSRNIANADTPLYSRKTAEIVTVPGSGVTISTIRRAEEPALLRSMLSANSDASAKKAVLDSVDTLNATVNDVELDASPAALLSKLRDAIQSYAAQPQSKLAGEAAVRAAVNMAQGLNNASDIVMTTRRDVETGIASSIDEINSSLVRFKTLNDKIVMGTQSGADVTDLLDQRDQVLSDLSGNIGIRTLTRPGNDMAIYTDSGVTLFDRIARSVSFNQSMTLAPGVPGNALFIDGVPVTGSGATMPLQSGKVVGLVQVRDQIALDYGRQLDEVARALITTFAESDVSAALPTVPGLFTYPGAPALPAAGTLIDGLAGSISVNANADPSRGGSVTRLRDGGISDPLVPNYVSNTTGAASYTDKLDSFVTKLNGALTFDGAAGLETTATLADFSSASVAWLQQQRKSADTDYQYSKTLYQRSSESHSKLTGVNLDEEMSAMLELERSFQTSAKILATVDSMYNALISALR